MLPSGLPMLALGTIITAVAVSVALAAPESAATGRLRCRCLPTQPCWPNSDTWAALGQDVGGRLIPTKPAAYECHNPNYDSAKCDAIKAGYHYDYWRQQQPGAVQQTNWEVFQGKGCLDFNQTDVCHQGAVPLYTVNATNFEDVQKTVRFAAKHNVRLVVKNTGHDYLGRSIGAYSLNLWVFYMKKIEFNDNFVPEGAPAGTESKGAVILGSGAIWRDVFKAADDHNVFVLGGADPTVGTSGGFCQGGGHHALSTKVGLCVDNVLQYKIVTADGELKVANAYQNKDLFWALRGGGGGTFGVVVEATYKTHPAFKNIVYATSYILYNITDPTVTRQKVINKFLSYQHEWSNNGWSGYAFIQQNSMAAVYYLPDQDVATATKQYQPFLDYANSVGAKAFGNLTSYSSFYDLFSATALTTGTRNAGVQVVLGSRLIPRSTFAAQTKVNKLSEAFMNIQDDLYDFGNPEGTILTHLVAGGQVAKGTTAETSVLPAWRRALMHVVLVASWLTETPPAEQQLVQRKLTQSTDRLRKLTPGSGAYVNEADPNEPDWKGAFFGANYKRLKSIKDQVDPHGLFACHNCVGSDDWNKDLLCPRRR